MAVQAWTSDNGAFNTTVTWATAATGDTFDPFVPGGSAALGGSIQASGTFGGATIGLQGSNDGSTWTALKDVAATTIALTAASMSEFSTAAKYIRPTISGGTGDAVVVIVNMVGR